MNKLFSSLLVAFSFFSFNASASFNDCKDYFPQNTPPSITIANPEQAKEICFNSFAVLYSGISKTPIFVVEKLNKQRIMEAKDEERTNKFYPEARLPISFRAQLSDYANSGYDRGHMAPAADMPDSEAMAQSFSLANIIPQDATNNRKIWSKIEKDVRKYAMRAKGNVYVFTGPIYTRGLKHKTIGSNNVWVPEQIFKLVFDEHKNKSWAYIVENKPKTTSMKPVQYDEFVKITGLPLLK